MTKKLMKLVVEYGQLCESIGYSKEKNDKYLDFIIIERDNKYNEIIEMLGFDKGEQHD